MKKLLVVVGGGRPNGNTNQLVDAFIKGAIEAGHEVEKICFTSPFLDIILKTESIY